MMAKKWVWFGVLATLSVVAVGVSILAIRVSGVSVYDSNLAVFHALPDQPPRLSVDEAEGIFRSVKGAAILAAAPPIAALGLWIAVTFLYLRRDKPSRRDGWPDLTVVEGPVYRRNASGSNPFTVSTMRSSASRARRVGFW